MAGRLAVSGSSIGHYQDGFRRLRNPQAVQPWSSTEKGQAPPASRPMPVGARISESSRNYCSGSGWRTGCIWRENWFLQVDRHAISFTILVIRYQDAVGTGACCWQVHCFLGCRTINIAANNFKPHAAVQFCMARMVIKTVGTSKPRVTGQSVVRVGPCFEHWTSWDLVMFSVPRGRRQNRSKKKRAVGVRVQYTPRATGRSPPF